MTVFCKACPFSQCNWSCIWSLSRVLTHQQSSQRSAASMLCARTDTQTQTNTPADRSSAGQHPSGRVLLSPAGSWQMPRLLPVITLALSQHASLSLRSPPLGFLLFLILFHPSLSPASHSSRVTQVLGALPSPPLPVSLLSCYVLSSSSSAHSDELASLQVSSGLSQHGWVAEGRERGGLC